MDFSDGTYRLVADVVETFNGDGTLVDSVTATFEVSSQPFGDVRFVGKERGTWTLVDNELSEQDTERSFHGLDATDEEKIRNSPLLQELLGRMQNSTLTVSKIEKWDNQSFVEVLPADSPDAPHTETQMKRLPR
jgi:hypothetical protein